MRKSALNNKNLNKEGNMKTAVIYARYSSDRQTEQSIEGQLRVCSDYADKNKIIIVDTYIDRAMSGTNDNRPAFKQMIIDSSKKQWDYVIVYKLDRFSRNKYENAIHKKTLRDNGVKLLSAMENIPDTPEGIILESLLEGMNQYYSAELAQKVKRGMRESRLKGQFTGGIIVYGYKAVDKKIVIDEDKAEIIRKMFAMADQGFTIREIISYLNNNGFDHKGKPFQKTAVYGILHNPKYIGKYSVDGEEYNNVYPPIVDTELFNRVQNKITKNKLGGNSIQINYLLRGKLYCGYCGHRLNGESGTSHTGEKYYFYKCSYQKKGRDNCRKKTIRKEDLEGIVLDMAMDLFTNKIDLDIIADEIIRVRKESAKEHNELNILVTRQREAQKALDNIIKAAEAGFFTATTRDRAEELEDEIANLNILIAKERNKLEQEISREEVMKYLTNGVRQKSPEILIELLINKITIWDDHIEIEFNYSNNTNPDEHETARRDFSISRNLYVMIATNCVLIARRQLLYDAHYLQVAQTTLQDYSVS